MDQIRVSDRRRSWRSPRPSTLQAGCRSSASSRRKIPIRLPYSRQCVGAVIGAEASNGSTKSRGSRQRAFWRVAAPNAPDRETPCRASAHPPGQPQRRTYSAVPRKPIERVVHAKYLAAGSRSTANAFLCSLCEMRLHRGQAVRDVPIGDPCHGRQPNTGLRRHVFQPRARDAGCGGAAPSCRGGARCTSPRLRGCRRVDESKGRSVGCANSAASNPCR